MRRAVRLSILVCACASSVVAAAPAGERIIPITIRERPQDADHDGRYESLDIDARLPIGRPHARGYVLGDLLPRDATDSHVISTLDIPGPVEERMTHQAMRFPRFVADAAGVATVHLCYDGEWIGSRGVDGPWRLKLWAVVDAGPTGSPVADTTFTAMTGGWSARRFGWERYRVREVSHAIRPDGEIRLRVMVDVLVAGPVELMADAHWPIVEPRAGKSEPNQPPLRWWGLEKVERNLPVGLHAVDLTVRLGNNAGEHPHGIDGDSLDVNLTRTMVLGASTLAWMLRPSGAQRVGY